MVCLRHLTDALVDRRSKDSPRLGAFAEAYYRQFGELPLPGHGLP
jgi:hypothetical protein